jgi:hypothetical protein
MSGRSYVPSPKAYKMPSRMPPRDFLHRPIWAPALIKTRSRLKQKTRDFLTRPVDFDLLKARLAQLPTDDRYDYGGVRIYAIGLVNGIEIR